MTTTDQAIDVFPNVLTAFISQHFQCSLINKQTDVAIINNTYALRTANSKAITHLAYRSETITEPS